MNTNKENIKVLPTTSKIPLPLDPLPALSENVMKKIRNDYEHRPPLKTINNQQSNLIATAGPSKKIKKVINESRYNAINPMLDTRHVTIRQKNEDLDWDFKVLKDLSGQENKKDNSITSLSDDEYNVIQGNNKAIQNVHKNRQINCLGKPSNIETPVLKSLETIGVKNVKKSLKRPHSRELQGIPSVAGQERKGDEKQTRRFPIHDRLHERLQPPDSSKKLYMTCLSRDYTCDMFTYLLSAENKQMFPRIPSITRACVINWLMKVNGADGDPTTIQTACWYLDAILGVGYVQLNDLQLVAAACYWIAQKLHGPTVQASRLVKCANRAFTSEQLMAAEKAVLKKLKFPRHPVVPQDYITYLSWCCDNAHPGEIEVAATFICMCGVMAHRKLCDEYPSVIGAAAVRNALLLLRKTEAMERLRTCSLFREIVKKSSSMSFVCSVQRKAVRLVSVPSYQYKAPLEQYGTGPHYIAQRVLKSAHDLANYRAHMDCSGKSVFNNKEM